MDTNLKQNTPTIQSKTYPTRHHWTRLPTSFLYPWIKQLGTQIEHKVRNSTQMNTLIHYYALLTFKVLEIIVGNPVVFQYLFKSKIKPLKSKATKRKKKGVLTYDQNFK